MANGAYSDSRQFELPQGWVAASPEVLELAKNQAHTALGVGAVGNDAEQRLADYYHVESDYAGALFLDIEPNYPFEIGPSDLLAVTTLSIELNPRIVRRVLQSKELRSIIHNALKKLAEPQHPLTDLQPGMLDAMWDLHDALRTVLQTEEKKSNWWVFASKLCARKRPELFPVRDRVVCTYLAAGQPLGRKDGQLGNFSTDIQVFAYLMTDKRIRDRLRDLQAVLARQYNVQPDAAVLRLLDAALWTAGTAAM